MVGAELTRALESYRTVAALGRMEGAAGARLTTLLLSEALDRCDALVGAIRAGCAARQEREAERLDNLLLTLAADLGTDVAGERLRFLYAAAREAVQAAVLMRRPERIADARALLAPLAAVWDQAAPIA